MHYTAVETRWHCNGTWTNVPAGTPVSIVALNRTMPEIRSAIAEYHKQGKSYVAVEILGRQAMLPKSMVCQSVPDATLAADSIPVNVMTDDQFWGDAA